MVTKTPSQVVSDNVDRIRRAKGISQETLAEAMGVTQANASTLLRYKTKWTVDKLHQAAELLGASPGYLLQPHEDDLND